jgi:hypothetical protein
MSDSRAIEQLAARLDEVLPPGSQDIFESSTDAPEIHAAVRLARATRPVLTGESRRAIEHRMRARANAVFGAPTRLRGLNGSLRLARWAAACLLIAMVGVVLAVALSGSGADRSSPPDDVAGMLHAPSSPHTSVVIPDDAVLAPARLTVTGSGSSSLFIIPGG